MCEVFVRVVVVVVVVYVHVWVCVYMLRHMLADVIVVEMTPLCVVFVVNRRT